MSPRTAGTLLALLSAASFGVMPVMTKAVYEGGADVVGTLSVRFTIAALVVLALARLRGEAFPRGRRLAALLALGGIGYVAQSLCYFSAVERIPGGLAALLLYTHPALVVLLAAVLLGQRPRAVSVACVLLATAGCALTIGPVSGGDRVGIALGLGSSVAYAFYVVLSSRALGTGGPLATSGTVLLASAVVYDAIALTRGADLPRGAVAWAALLGVALVGTVVAVVAFFAALPRLGPSDTAAVSTAEPVIAVLVGFLVLGEVLGPLQLVGGALVVAAVAVLARVPARSEGTVPA